MSGVQTIRGFGRRCIEVLSGCACAASAAASGAPGAEGVALAILLLPAAVYLIAVAVLLLFGVFAGRRWLIANVVGSALTAALVCLVLARFELPPGGAGASLVFGTLAVLALATLAPCLQYHSARKQWRAVSAGVRVMAALALGAPLATWCMHEYEGAKFEQARQDITARGRTAHAGDLAAVVREHAGNALHTAAFGDYLRGLQHSPLLLDAAPLNDDDRAAAERLIADRSTYFGPLHAKLVWDRHAGDAMEALLSDPDAPAVRYHLLEILERHAVTRYCGNSEDIRALRSGVQRWFADQARHASDDDAPRNASIESLCAR